ncbi:MAG: hypothetical protein JXR27_04020 [Paludibacteraceae bacterium]|nr:hypothetical protein [Paludibacteraceae bacterium]
MKTLKLIIVSLAVALFSVSCDDLSLDGLLKDVQAGKMVVIVDNGAEEIINCTFENFGQWTGEVFITGTDGAASSEKFVNFMYGHYNNTMEFTKRTYKSDEEFFTVYSSWGDPTETEIVSVTVTDRTDTAIKGYFSGKVSSKTGTKDFKGAFWATLADN